MSCSKPKKGEEKVKAAATRLEAVEAAPRSMAVEVTTTRWETMEATAR